MTTPLPRVSTPSRASQQGPSRHGVRLLSCGVLLAVGAGTLAPAITPAAHAEHTAEDPAPATVLLEETFDDTAGDPPAGWSLEHTNTGGMRPGWEGWAFTTPDEVVSEWGASGDRGSFNRAEGNIAVVHSDNNRPAEGRFDATLWSAPAELPADAQALDVTFDTHYKQGQSPQEARLLASFDGAEPVTIANVNTALLNQRVDYNADIPDGAEEVRIGWEYANSSNNWFWMLDNVTVSTAQPADSVLSIIGATKPVARAGDEVTVRVGGMRTGQELTATTDSAATIAEIAPANDAGETDLTVGIPADASAGAVPINLSGAGVTPLSFDITVLATSQHESVTTEPQLWFDGLENPDTWELEGDSAWQMTTREAVTETYGTDRRHAFTRASGTIAVAESTGGAFDGTLTSAPIELTERDRLELRFDHHYRNRGEGQRATVTAIYDTGDTDIVAEYDDTDEESAQARTPLTVPEGAEQVRFEFAFTAPATTGSWMIDDVQLVQALPELAADAAPAAAVDIFSDVQGANSQLRNQILPGLGGLEPAASTIVGNGDLTSNGTEAQYNSYLNAFVGGGGDRYDTNISTIGNHEFFGYETNDTYINRFLDRLDMRDVGGQGGLWGEVLVDDALPVLWIGSEYHDYASQTGSGPFVELSNEQFDWLSSRLEHYRAQNMPVMLFTHHVFANSVSGSYINFYKNDFGEDQERLETLLGEHPNVTVVTSHTHWSTTLNDWSVEQRFNPATAQAPTIINTGAVTTMYGPSGDWGEAGIGGADPVALRAHLYDDRIRVTAYSFDRQANPTEIRHTDIPLHQDAPAPPTDGGEDGDNEAGGDGSGSDGSDGAEPGGDGDTGENTPSQPQEPAPGDAGTAAGPLANTGSAAMPLILALAAALILAGGGAMLLRRRAHARG